MIEIRNKKEFFVCLRKKNKKKKKKQSNGSVSCWDFVWYSCCCSVKKGCDCEQGVEQCGCVRES